MTIRQHDKVSDMSLLLTSFQQCSPAVQAALDSFSKVSRVPSASVGATLSPPGLLASKSFGGAHQPALLVLSMPLVNNDTVFTVLSEHPSPKKMKIKL